MAFQIHVCVWISDSGSLVFTQTHGPLISVSEDSQVHPFSVDDLASF